jgi:hypothetical protein
VTRLLRLRDFLRDWLRGYTDADARIAKMALLYDPSMPLTPAENRAFRALQEFFE